MFGFIPMFYEPSYGSVTHWERVSFDSGAFHTFARSQDLFGRIRAAAADARSHARSHVRAYRDGGLSADGDG
jgi:hypothetical protein